MARYRTKFLWGPFDADVIECYERPRNYANIVMERREGKQAAIYLWSDDLSMWVFHSLHKKSDFTEIKK